MNAFVKYATKKTLGEQMNMYKNKKACGDEDPYFEMVPTGRRGKKKKVKRRIPDYIPEHDAQVLANVRKLAYRLDMCLFSFMGVRFGWSSVIGLVPEIGDIFDFAIAWKCYTMIKKVDCPLSDGTLRKMRWNIYVDLVIGLVPFIGDLFDAGWKCNTKNAVLLSEALDKHYAKDRRGVKLDECTRQRLSRQLFEDDPDFALGPPPYSEYPIEQLPKQSSRWDWFRRWGNRDTSSDPERG